MNPYGALTSAYKSELVKMQKNKLVDYTSCKYLFFIEFY